MSNLCPDKEIVIKEIKEEKRVEIDYQDNLLRPEI